MTHTHTPSPSTEKVVAVHTATHTSASVGAISQRRQHRSNSRNSSLLLRLFTSQFFDAWLAVSYIFRYAHLVGVQHYLCNELRKFPQEEVEFFLPQLVHLLITRPNESVAVESLLMDMSLRSSHTAIILYWYLQAYLSDLAPNPRTASFKHCQRVFNQVQELLFTDIAPELIIDAPEPVQHTYLHAMENVKTTIPRAGPLSSLSARFRSMLRLSPQVREDPCAALVGIGSVMASAGAPSLASTMGWIAVAQGQTTKLSENIDEDLDSTPQYRLLSGKTRGGNTSVPGHSVLAGRTRPSSYAGSSGREEGRMLSPTTPIAMDWALGGSADSGSSQGSSAALLNHGRPHVIERTFVSSSLVPPAPSGVVSAYTETGNMALEHTAGIRTTHNGGMGSENKSTPIAAATDPMQHKPIVQHMAVSSGVRTPVQRASTDSCRTVAVMEGLDHVDSTASDLGTVTGDSIGSESQLACRSYLNRATRQFQRNARQLDRRLSRSYGGSVAPTSSSNDNIIPLPGYSASINKSWDIYTESSEAMRATLDGMATFMEMERVKLERRTGYFGAEIKFITALMDISQRLCEVPKSRRQQSLKAELTLFNHSLDRNTCIPLWCSDLDGSHHHRIVRIPTEDTVVLNSAERAPYLLTLEVLEPVDSDVASSPRSSPSGTCEGIKPDALGDAHLDEDSANTFSSSVNAEVSRLDLHGKLHHATDNSDALTTPLSTSKTESETELSSATSAIEATTASTGNNEEVTSSTVDRAPLSPTLAEDVDEKLMAEVFGDIDDVSGIPDTPLSSEANRQRSGYSGAYINSRAFDAHLGAVPLGRANTSGRSLSNDRAQRKAEVNSLNSNRLSRTEALDFVPESSPSGIGKATQASISQEDIRARMRTASILLAQLARQQKSLGIKVANLVVSQPHELGHNDSSTARADIADTSRRRGKLGNAATQALVMEEIREKLVREMMQLEEIRLKQPGLPRESGADAEQDMEGDISMREVEFKDDPSAKVLKEDWESKKARIRRASPYGRHKNWNLLSVIVKEGADLRQEQLALQLIREMQRIWQREKTDVFVQYYHMMVTGKGRGIMETITNTVSVHSIKKEFYSRNPSYSGPPYTLYNYFITTYGTPDTTRFREAQDCFMRSLVAYSLITYVLQIRDRHNGNILLDTAGHAIHIDFGFMLYNSPGSVGFEQAPFKFPMEYIDILGGRESAKFAEFRELLVKAFITLRKHADNICLLVEMMVKDSPLPCLGGNLATVAALRERFHLTLSESQMEELVDGLLISSCDNITTRMYDAFQYYSNGIL
ncbi:Phosphatidylinositol 4-kinase pik1alpha (PI4-kinase)(PtdIns-4-kinase) [Coemansia sp. RSA 1365]|nr:Phosphatidylinositol 4-kinase pik1alpha (PI4-kinase)(PtdIns-4-kinase) [Coemansia sp. RSA 1365]